MIPHDSHLAWLPLFYTLPEELVIKRKDYLNIPRNPYDVLYTDKYNYLTFETLQKYIDENKVSGNRITGGGLSPKTLKSHMTVLKLVFIWQKTKCLLSDTRL